LEETEEEAEEALLRAAGSSVRSILFKGTR